MQILQEISYLFFILSVTVFIIKEKHRIDASGRVVPTGGSVGWVGGGEGVVRVNLDPALVEKPIVICSSIDLRQVEGSVRTQE